MILLPFLLASAAASPIAHPRVQTSYGTVVGTTSEYRHDVLAFKGMPYAQPPIGDLRWVAPQQPKPWGGVYNATAFRPQCNQVNYQGTGLWTTGSDVMSEDCLYINVWAPNNHTDEKLPVYVWMYGGRFVQGSGDVITYDGSGLASKGVIVVTFNYRLGPFGFFAHPDLSAESAHNSSGNYGTMDLIAAVQWVHDEIASFGGDPERITVGGQSSGSSCALDMMYSPLSSDLIHGVIAESGARAPHDPMTGSLATSYRKKDAAESNGVSFMASMNATTIAEMRQLSAEVLLTADQLNDTIFDGTPFENVTTFMEPPEWRPILDGYVLPATYGEILRSNAHADIPIMTGNNLDESGAALNPGLEMATYQGNFTYMFGNLSSEFFQLYPANTTTQANTANNAIFDDISRVSTWIWGKDWYNGGAKSNVYTYFWTHAPPGQDLGAFHGSEMYYVFNNLPYNYPDMPWTADDYRIQAVMVEYWVNFIKRGDPNGGNLTYWPPTSDETKTMWLGDSWGVGSIADEERISFVEEWFAQYPEW